LHLFKFYFNSHVLSLSLGYLGLAVVRSCFYEF